MTSILAEHIDDTYAVAFVKGYAIKNILDTVKGHIDLVNLNNRVDENKVYSCLEKFANDVSQSVSEYAEKLSESHAGADGQIYIFMILLYAFTSDSYETFSTWASLMFSDEQAKPETIDKLIVYLSKIDGLVMDYRKLFLGLYKVDPDIAKEILDHIFRYAAYPYEKITDETKVEIETWLNSHCNNKIVHSFVVDTIQYISLVTPEGVIRKKGENNLTPGRSALLMTILATCALNARDNIQGYFRINYPDMF